jgi:hypothetical protein
VLALPLLPIGSRKRNLTLTALFAPASPTAIQFAKSPTSLKSPDTVCAIAERECNNLPPAKETILSKTKVAARLAVERVTDEIQAMSGKDAAIAYGILTDKMLLLSGEANVVIAKQREAPTHQDFNAMIEALPTASVREIDTQLIARATLPPVVDETPAPLTVSQTTPQQ